MSNLRFVRRPVTLTLLMLAATLVSAGAAEPPPGPNTALGTLQPNKWTKLPLERNPIGRSYSGIAGAYGGGFIFYFGGGHGSHLGNEVDLFDVQRSAWIQATEAEFPQPGTPGWAVTGGWGTTELTPKGRPYAEHTYQLTCYDAVQKVFVSALSSGTWTFNPQSRQWRRLTPDRPESADVHTKMLAYDPGLGAVLYFATTSGQRGVYRFDYAKTRWVRVGNVPPDISWSSIYSTYDAGRRLHLISNSRTGLWTYDASRDLWRRITSMPKELVGVNSFAYDVQYGDILFVQASTESGTEVWTYHSDGDRWKRVPTHGDVPQGASTAAWGTLVYVPEYKAFILLNTVHAGGGGVGGHTETWAYRYAP